MVGSAHATTVVATFADPGGISFTYSDGTDNAMQDGVLTGGFLGTGLNLILQGVQFDDVTFTITTMFAEGPADVNGIPMDPVATGELKFFDSAANLLVTMTFEGAHLTAAGVGAPDALGESVGIVLPSGDPFTDPESFAFSFANLAGDLAAVQAGNAGVVTATAAFTSSATVPEPTTLLLTGTALVGFGAWQGWVRRRRVP
jgi:hypothetical protein